MSDTSQGPGWWQASDGKWYPPQQTAPAPGAPPPGGAYPGGAPGDTTMGMLCHLLGIFTGFVGPLIIWLMKKDEDPFVAHNGVEALNFQITLVIAYVVSFVLMIIIIGILTFFVAWVLSLIWMIQGSIAANKGEYYKYPINIRFIKGAVGV